MPNEPDQRNPFAAVPSVDETKLVCRIGDLLAVRADAVTEEGERIRRGESYEVVSRVGYGWNLHLNHGKGATVVRVLNSSVLKYFERAV